MTNRAIARHRALKRVSTPLTQVTGNLADNMGSLGRVGAVVAASSGLVAAVGLPARAAGEAPRAAAVAAQPLKNAAPVSGKLLSAPAGAAFLAAPSVLDATAPVAAPATATVTFEATAFATVPAPRVTAPAPERPAAAPAARPARPAAAQPATRREAKELAKQSSAKKAPAKKKKVAAKSDGSGGSIVSIARQYTGIPYKYGGTTTSGFDCSGFTAFVYKKAGLSLPRTSKAQYSATRRVSNPRPGDLVFFFDGGSVYHVGIYTGNGKLIDSPRSGKRTTERAIWSSNVAYGRL